MQETVSFLVSGRPYPDFKVLATGVKWVLIIVWKPIRWTLEAMFLPPPGQEYIEEARNKALSHIGHF